MAKPKLQKFIKVAVRSADGAILLNTGKASNPNTPCQQQVRAAFAAANLGGQCKSRRPHSPSRASSVARASAASKRALAPRTPVTMS
jgi:hypothetical protein